MNLKPAVINLEKIKTNPFNPKKDFKDYELRGFDLSLKKWGVIRQLVVCNSPFTAGEFIILDGNSLFEKLKKQEVKETQCQVLTQNIANEQELKRLTLDYNLALKNIDTQALSALFKDVKDQERLENEYNAIFDIAAEFENIQDSLNDNFNGFNRTELIAFRDQETHDYFKKFIGRTKKITEKHKLMKFINTIQEDEITENLPILLNAIKKGRGK